TRTRSSSRTGTPPSFPTKLHTIASHLRGLCTVEINSDTQRPASKPCAAEQTLKTRLRAQTVEYGIHLEERNPWRAFAVGAFQKIERAAGVAQRLIHHRPHGG